MFVSGCIIQNQCTLYRLLFIFSQSIPLTWCLLLPFCFVTFLPKVVSLPFLINSKFYSNSLGSLTETSLRGPNTISEVWYQGIQKFESVRHHTIRQRAETRSSCNWEFLGYPALSYMLIHSNTIIFDWSITEPFCFVGLPGFACWTTYIWGL